MLSSISVAPGATVLTLTPIEAGSSLVKTLALEGAEDELSVSAVCPAYVRTPLVEKQIADQARAHRLPEERVLEEVILAPHAVKRLIEPSGVARVVGFLAGPRGSAFTGAPVTMEAGPRAGPATSSPAVH